MKVYPLFLNNLADQRCVVIGGGHEAERKAAGLLECDAVVTVIHPALSEQLQRWAAEERITWVPRAYRPGDLQGAFLAIVSEFDAETAQVIWQEAQAEKVLLNTMDDVPHCTFVAGSVVRRGPLVVSISTSGCAPALSVRLRQELEQRLGPEYGTFLELMARLREPMAARYPDFDERRRRWYDLVDAGLLDAIRRDDLDAVRQGILAVVGEDIDLAVSTT